ncbi:MAG: protein kinase [Edaphobacter sp.]|uniref:protein kinase domain-containing protein n=1 Tax=Edaphobacter sp. TaxID=1934404 RepID=UPI0023A61DD9|nr:serine/threonine-protein kinase [Edaphobacter sp.]MDE1178241.1 protein kinase [Edaphobacter sp.]
MGVVWRAFDTVLNTDVALKVLLNANDTTALKLFYEECHKQSALAHPNIVEIRDVGSFDEDGIRQPYLVMPLLRGITLASIIRSPQPLSTERCIDIFSQVGRGLQAAHDFGLLHRDIKPSNLFILEDDSVKIIDFGVAHRLDVSHTVGRKGTLLYMSPEQLSMKPLTRASDVFSLAVVCYEVLTRRQPFLASTEDAMVDAIQHLNPPPASSLNPNVSVSIGQVICKGMAKDPRHRFASVKEFSEYLRRAHHDDSFLVFDPHKFAPRLDKASEAYQQGNLEFAQELVNELESEGYQTPELESLTADIKSATRKRSVDHLLESAHARVQDGEYRLALQRVSEVLQLDPRREEALVLQHDIEALRAEADIADWLRVGQQHLDKFSFSHARQAAQRILETKPGEERALQFLSQVERREAEVQRIREHKREAYAVALDAERRNEITSALSKMKLVLELEAQAPELKEPGQIAAYQSLYNRLHSEHEAIAASYGEAKQALERGDYAAASQLCDRFLEKFPQHTLFKALRFDIEQRWRRAISIRLIEVEEAVENEPDLDHRVQMLEEVVRENGEVPEFDRLLQGTREKRDLVNGIVSRARELEARELHGEALVQWETLQTIYPMFPGLGFEIENVRLRRELGERMARKNHWTTQISQAVEAGDFEEGASLLSPAVEEFPNDAEFAEIHTYIQQHRELAEEAERKIRDGRQFLDEGEIGQGLEKLRGAYEIGSKVKRAKAELVEGLLRAARASQGDPPQARIYLKEILNLDQGNHAATGLLRFLDEQAEHQQADELLSQARQLRTNNDLGGAIRLLKGACAEYPRNARLRQALREMDTSRDEMRSRDLEVVRRKRLEADTLVSIPSLHEHIASVEGIAERYRDDEEFQNESRMLRDRLHTIAVTTVPPPVSSVPTAVQENVTSIKQIKKLLPVFSIGAAALLLVILCVFLWHRPASHKQDAPVAPIVPPDVTVRSTPSGAHILRDGQEIGVAAPTLTFKASTEKTSLEARLDGYESQSETIDSSTGHGREINFALRPLSQQLRIAGRGTLSLDGGSAAALPMGVFSGELAAGRHTLHWRGRGGYDATFEVNVSDGAPATLTAPIHASQSGAALVVSVAAQQAHVYTNPAMSVIVDGDAKGIANGSGLDTPLSAGLHTIIARKNSVALVSKIVSGSERLLSVTFENAPTPGSLTVLTDVDGVGLKLLHGTTTIHEGTSVAGKLDIPDLPVGSYILQATTAASAPVNEQKLVITQGQNTTVSFHFKQKPALIPLRVRTSPGASILVDGKEAGTTGTNGVLLISSLPAGAHHIEARRHGKTAVLDVNLVEGDDKAHAAELKLDAGEGTVSLQLNPADSDVTVYAANGKQVPITGTHFDLPEGKYHFIARANGYIDRAEAVEVTAENSIPVNLALSLIAIDKAAPSITGWQSASWAIDAQSHALTHTGPDISLYSAQPGHGRYIFSGSVGHAFLFSKPKVEWVAGYRDSNNYLLFSLDRTGLELFTIKDGKRLPNGSRIIFAPVSKYQILLQVLPGHIVTSLGDGHQWKLLSDWTGLPDDVDAGRFGFKGPVTLNSFSHTP